MSPLIPIQSIIPKNHVIYDEYNNAVLIRQGKDNLILSPGLYISLPTHPNGVKIIEIIGNIIGYNGVIHIGPIGFTYLPYRHLEGRWAPPGFSLRGDPRFIICSQGITHYGLQTDLETLELINSGIPPPIDSIH